MVAAANERLRRAGFSKCHVNVIGGCIGDGLGAVFVRDLGDDQPELLLQQLGCKGRRAAAPGGAVAQCPRPVANVLAQIRKAMHRQGGIPADPAIASAVAAGIEYLSADFYKIGVHENFYDELKRYVKTMKG